MKTRIVLVKMIPLRKQILLPFCRDIAETDAKDSLVGKRKRIVLLIWNSASV